MNKKTHRRVYVFRINYFVRSKKLYDIIVVPKKPPYLARYYHDAIKKANLLPAPINYCGEAFVVQGGGGANETNLDTYKLI